MSSPYFYINSDRIMKLDSIDLIVLWDSRQELLPGTHDVTEEIPGKHGAIDFGTTLRPRLLELHVAVDTTLETRDSIKRTIAKHLDPTAGVKTLGFADETNKVYHVKYSGNIDLTQYPSWLKFVIPFKMSDPLIKGATQKSRIGAGVATNAGTFLAPVVIEVHAQSSPVTNPTVSFGSNSLSYVGTVAMGSTLIIDTDKMTVVMDNNSGTITNGLNAYNGDFPHLPPGNTNISASGGSLSAYWYDRYI